MPELKLLEATVLIRQGQFFEAEGIFLELDAQVAAADLWPAFVAGAGTELMGDHPARLVAAAAAAGAAGHRDRATELLERASVADARAPTYYGAALTALGWTLLTTDRLGGCGPLR